jgi:ankyrin repeat protein
VKNINQKNRFGSTLLYEAISSDYPPQYRHAEDGHLDHYPADRDDSIEPWEATSRLKLQMVELLLAQGADVNLRTDFGEMPLHAAVDYADEDMVRLLLTHGADVDGRVKRNTDAGPGPVEGETPLHYAAIGGRVELVSLLLARGAEVNACDDGDDTPLHGAALRGHREVVELLVTHGADVSARNSRGRTPLDEAIRRGHEDIVRLFTAKAKNSDTAAQDDGTRR